MAEYFMLYTHLIVMMERSNAPISSEWISYMETQKN